MKIYDIACSVADGLALLHADRSRDCLKHSNNILGRFREFLSSFRGGNQTLVDQLCRKVAFARRYDTTMFPASIPPPGSSPRSIMAHERRVSEVTDEPEQTRTDIGLVPSAAGVAGTMDPVSHLDGIPDYSGSGVELLAFEVDSQCLQRNGSVTPGLEWLLSNVSQNENSASDFGVWPFQSLDHQLCDSTMLITSTPSPLST